MKKLIYALFLVGFTLTANAQTIFGKWQSKNEDTGKVESVIEVYEKDGKAFAKIVEIMNPDRKNAVCDLCKGKKKNQPIMGMDILSGLKKDGKEWSGGKIVDPKSGKEYKCYIELESADKLKIRGYIGFALIGRTAYWYRKN